MELAKLYVTIAADTKKLTVGLAQAKGEITKTTAGMGAQFKTMGIGMVAAGAMITAAFGLTVKAAIQEQKELAQVSTMLDDLSMKYMPEFAEGLDRLAIEFGDSSAALSKGLYDILSASIEPAKALNVLAVASKAATAGITDTGVAADAITTIINSYGLEAEDAGKVSDQLFAIVKRGKTTFAQLAPAIGTVASTANMAGLSFEDLGASIATLTRAGINTNAAMTSISGVLNAFLKPQTDATTLAWDKFGLALNTTTLKTIGLTGVMEKLKDATAEELAQIFGSIRGLKGMAAALGDAEGYATDYKLMLESAGLTQDAFEKQAATVGFQLGRLKQAFGVLAEEIGAALLPIIELLTKGILAVTKAMVNFAKAHPTLTKAITLLGAALGILVGVGGVVILGTIAFEKMRIALLTLKAAYISIKAAVIGVEAVTSGALIPSLLKAKFAVSALATAWIAAIANALIWTEVYKGVVSVLEDAKRIREAEKAQIEAQTIALEELKNAYNMTGEELQYWIENQKLAPSVLERTGIAIKDVGETAATTSGNIDDLDDSVEGLGDQLGTTGDKLDEFGNKIETFREWVARLEEETAEANKKMADAAEEAYERYADAMQPIEDRLYELSHTEEEVAAKNLLNKKNSLEETIKAAELSAEKEKAELTKIQEWYDQEIELIKGKLEEERDALIETAKQSEESATVQKKAIEGIKDEYDELIDKIGEMEEAAKKAAKAIAFALELEAWHEAHPTTPEEEAYIAAHQEEHPEAVSHQRGTPYIRRTGIYKIHEGEAVFPKKYNPFSRGTLSNVFNNQRSSNTNSYSPSVTVNILGGGDASEIKRAVEQALAESARQYNRRGFELVPGMS